MKYSSGLKASVVKRVLPPENQSIKEVSQETGIGASTIRYWKKQAETGSLEIGERQLRPSDRSSAEKLTLLLESRSVSKEERGEWLRARGLHSEHLPLWEQELREVVTEREKKQRKEITELKSRNRDLEKELNRKEKALAETAALLALKKKANAIWGENEDD
jgi:transposase-like protein